MNRQSLNRAIGLALSALQQARAYGYSAQSIVSIRAAIQLLNKARGFLKSGNVEWARFHALVALENIRSAIALR